VQSFFFGVLINSFAPLKFKALTNPMKGILHGPKAIFALIFTICFSAFSIPVLASAEGGEAKFDVLHHVMDDHVWHIADGAVLPLPIIIYSAENGLDIFSSGNF
jgi:hypothetical protein